MLSRKDGQRELIELVCARFRAWKGVTAIAHWDEVDLDAGQNYVLNRARFYRDRRDFVIQPDDTGKRGDYPTKLAQ